jgi:hypothetical protein
MVGSADGEAPRPGEPGRWVVPGRGRRWMIRVDGANHWAVSVDLVLAVAAVATVVVAVVVVP